ncbi:MAG: NADH-quinone oxidoreductase subunit C [Candidatus Halichondribacter symbioticus]
MTLSLSELGDLIAEAHTLSADQVSVTPQGELVLSVGMEALCPLIDSLRKTKGMKFSTLIDITAIDWLGREPRFDLVYHLLSMYSNQRLRIKTQVREDTTVPSLSAIHPSAIWFEREVFDMYGLTFANHPDLRRLLTDYGFEGHPLRKDFPTTGYVELRYSESEKRVVYEPVKLTQEYRQFDFMSPWEGAEYILDKEEGDVDVK